MQLSKVVGAILNDLSMAQDLANEYSSQLSYKYRKSEHGKDRNILSNFRVPSTVLSEISLELKFVIQEITSDTLSLDIEKTQQTCDDLATRCVLPLHESLFALTGNQQVVRGILTSEFLKTLETRVSQALFNLCERFFAAEKELTRSDVNNAIAGNLETELLQNKGIQTIPELRVEINSSSDDPIYELSRVREAKERLRSLCLSCAEAATKEIDVSTLIIIQITTGTPNTHIAINSGDLKNVPVETIQCLHISAKYDSSGWAISESRFT